MIPSKKHLLKLGLVSLTAITVGVVIGLVLNYQTLRKLREEPPLPSVPTSQVEEKEEEKIATYSGKIKPAGGLFEGAEHYLENEEGEVIVLLESSTIDLGFIEGQSVEVEGKIKETVEGEPQILEVEKVRF